MTQEELFEQTDGYLVGLWRFRERGRTPLWCATYTVDGYYFDVSGKRTVAGALRAVLRDVKRSRRRRGGGLKADGARPCWPARWRAGCPP